MMGGRILKGLDKGFTYPDTSPSSHCLNRCSSMEPPAPASRYTTQERVHMNGSDSSSMILNDVEILEIPPHDFGASNRKKYKQKEVIGHEIIDLESEGVSGGELLSNVKGSTLKNHKVSKHEIIDLDLDEYLDGQLLTYAESSTVKKLKKAMHVPGDSSLNNETGSCMQTPNKSIFESHDSNGFDDSSHGLFFKEDQWIDNYYDDIVFDDADDEYTKWASQFDKISMPAGVEVEFPLPNSSGIHNAPHISSKTQVLPQLSTSSFPFFQMSPPVSVPSSSSGVQMKTSNSMKNVLMGQSMMGYQKLTQPFALAQHMKSYSSFYGNHQSTEPEKFSKWVQDARKSMKSESIIEITPSNENQDMGYLGAFKKFDTVDDCSGHYFLKKGTSQLKPKAWAKRIQQEWKILENDLPEKIFVRAYESRMDLMRAVIIGVEGTPYHDGLFFFDIFFPNDYPNKPPLFHYHSGGLRINPNLYNCGKVCLSLLNTWQGGKEEKWIPGVSTMLQVMLSIQAMILNTDPFYNEPGCLSMKGSDLGKMRSLEYNENTFIYNLKTMVYSMNKPPKHFEDLVVAHFCERARQILLSCKAYLQGAQVCTLVEGGTQAAGDLGKSCSNNFKKSLSGYVGTVLNSFKKIGAKDCEEFLNLACSKKK